MTNKYVDESQLCILPFSSWVFLRSLRSISVQYIQHSKPRDTDQKIENLQIRQEVIIQTMSLLKTAFKINVEQAAVVLWKVIYAVKKVTQN